MESHSRIVLARVSMVPGKESVLREWREGEKEDSIEW
jgi:hypothetical protein